MKTCALTGHRSLPPDFNANAVYDMLETLIREGYDEFYCGMAEGFDLIALDCLVALKGRYHVRVVACIPFEGQEKAFAPMEKKKYRDLLAWCEQKIVLFPSYRNGCYLVRDRYMVDRADALLAYCTREKGGSAYTVKYANEKGIPVYRV